MVVLTVSQRGQARAKHAFGRTFTIGNSEGCDLFVFWENQWMPGQQIHVRIAVEGIEVRLVENENGFELNDIYPDLTFPHYLRAGDRFTKPGIEIVIEQVPELPPDIAVLPPRIDASDAAAFERDTDHLSSIRPPPRPRIDDHELTLDDLGRTGMPSLDAVLRFGEWAQIGELERALGVVLPEDLMSWGTISIRGGAPRGGLVAFSVSHTIGILQGVSMWMSEVRRQLIDECEVEWSHGRAACEPRIAGSHHFFLGPKEGDGFVLCWYRERPQWSIPCDHALRHQWVTWFVEQLEVDGTWERVSAMLDAAPAAAGLVRGGPGLVFWPRIRMSDLVQLLGCRRDDVSEDYPAEDGAAEYTLTRTAGAWVLTAKSYGTEDVSVLDLRAQ